MRAQREQSAVRMLTSVLDVTRGAASDECLAALLDPAAISSHLYGEYEPSIVARGQQWEVCAFSTSHLLHKPGALGRTTLARLGGLTLDTACRPLKCNFLYGIYAY